MSVFYNSGIDAPLIKDSNQVRRANTTMSGKLLQADRPTTPEKDDYDPVYIPAAFKKTRQEKVGDQSKVLTRLQGLMQDVRKKEVQV